MFFFRHLNYYNYLFFLTNCSSYSISFLKFYILRGIFSIFQKVHLKIHNIIIKLILINPIIIFFTNGNGFSLPNIIYKPLTYPIGY